MRAKIKLCEMALLNKRIVESIIDNLSRAPGMHVLAYNTVQHYQGRELTPQAVGNQLLVRMVVAGEMARPNDDLLLHVELIEVRDGSQRWGAEFKESHADAVADPERLSRRIYEQLLPALASALIRGRDKRAERAA
jgi:TolB-like protein